MNTGGPQQGPKTQNQVTIPKEVGLKAIRSTESKLLPASIYLSVYGYKMLLKLLKYETSAVFSNWAV
jgi:hypothetical protein